jgi:hypothetical protein
MNNKPKRNAIVVVVLVSIILVLDALHLLIMSAEMTYLDSILSPLIIFYNDSWLMIKHISAQYKRRCKNIFSSPPYGYMKKKKLYDLSPRANYTVRATAACRRSDCQLLRIEGVTWSAWRIPTAVISIF